MKIIKIFLEYNKNGKCVKTVDIQYDGISK